jgi:phospholipase/carboxylesterase
MANNNITKLSGPEQKPLSGNQAKQLVVLLHGLGADGNDLFGLVPYFSKALPDAHFISPNAPFSCDMAPFGKQWFSLLDRSEDKILEGVKYVAPTLNAFLDTKLESLGLTDENLSLVGFSQGTMLALYTALRRQESMAGVLGYSGALVGAKLLEKEVVSRPELCLVHGEDDQVVPFEAFKEAIQVLQKAGFFVNGYSREGLAHGIDPAGMQIGCAFLRRVYHLDQQEATGS